MLNTYLNIYNSLLELNKLDSMLTSINEGFQMFDPYKAFEVFYMEIYRSYKINPSMYNKGRLQSIWDIMCQLLTVNRANTIKQKVITRYNQNTNR